MNLPEKLLNEIASHLVLEFGDVPDAEVVARLIGEEVLSWRPPEIAAAQVTTILAFTFGNRTQPNGNRTPGPVNEALADITARLHGATGAPVYAQWEVAEAAESKIPPDRLLPTMLGAASRPRGASGLRQACRRATLCRGNTMSCRASRGAAAGFVYLFHDIAIRAAERRDGLIALHPVRAQ